MKRSLLILGATLAGSTLAWLFARWWWHPSTVLLLDTSREVAQALSTRADASAPELPAEIDELGRMLPGMLAEEATETAVALFYPAVRRTGWEYDPLLLFRRSPHLELYQRFPEHPDGGWEVHTNDLGFREDHDVAGTRRAFRVLVIGDSHTCGACATDESFANVLEERLKLSRPGLDLDVLNAAQGAYDPFNYLGAPAAFEDLEPDVLVVCVYGGNDFLGVLGLRRYLFRRGPHRKTPFDRRLLLDTGKRAIPLLGQELDQVLHLLNNPEESQVALTIVCAITAEIARQCTERGTALIVAYLPPPSRVQPGLFRAELDEALATTNADPGALHLTYELGEAFVSFLQARGLTHVDLRGELAGSQERLFWSDDLHLNVAGHRRVAGALEALVAPCAPK